MKLKGKDEVKKKRDNGEIKRVKKGRNIIIGEEIERGRGRGREGREKLKGEENSGKGMGK